MKEIDYSIIIPVYYNESSIEKTFNILEEKVISENKELNCELIFIDDGSKDSSFNQILKLKEKHPELIKIIKFTRNFGQISAINAGYKYAKGKCIIVLSADLQDPPELINQMIAYHFNDKYDIVVCSRESREDSFFKRKTSDIFYKLIKKLSFPNMPSGGFDYALISRQVRNIIIEKQESNPFWQGQILWTGYQTKFIPYKRKQREIGKSKWTFSKKIKYLIDGITSYSYFPVRLMSVVGSLIALVGFLYAIFIIFTRIFGSNIPYGWAPLMVVILLLSGIQMLMIGIVGEYLWRVLDQVRNRHPYIIDKFYD